MQTVGPLNGTSQPACPRVTTTTNFGLTECNWASAYTLTVPTTWTTGNYIVKLIRSDSGLESYMTFVVRNDAAPADIVLSMDVSTWQAYNFWGGAGNGDVGYNLYGKFNDVSFSSSSTRAYAVSFNRPYLDQGAQDGAGNFMVWDYPMVRWLESQGYNVTYATDVDIETNPSLLNGRKAFINTGHDEYYSDNMRNNLQGYISGGAHMGFFSANNVYNRIRWANSSSGQADRTVICYKDAAVDPQSPATIRWRDLTPPQPENALLGVMQNGTADDRALRVYDSSSWIYAGTGLVNYVSGTPVTSGSGQNAIAGIVGYEFDERAANDSTLSSFVSSEPVGLQQVAHSNVPATDNGVVAFSDATLYTASSGAIVFSAGTIQWSWGLDNGYNDGYCDCNPGYANSKSKQITANILNKFLGTTTGTAPAVTLSPPSLAFGNQPVSSTSAAQSVTVTNSGSAALTISSITLAGTNPGDYAQTNTCPTGSTTLAAGSSCTISVTFAPTATGSRTASISIADSASGSPHTVSLSGTGTAPGVTLNPTSLTFGNQPQSTTSAAQSVTLTNTGTAPLTISSISVGGANPADFAQTTTCPISPSTLAAGAKCTINVTFTPSTISSESANLSVSDTAGDSPQSVALSGTGTAPAPVVSLAPTSLSFSSQVVNTTSAAQNVTLTNSGNADLTISSIGLTGTNPGDFTQTTTCPASPSTLTAGSSCTISVTFTPTATGTRSASVAITDNASGSPQSVALTGTGASAPAPAVTLNPTNLTFSSQLVNTTSAAQSVTLTNSGTAALTISSIGLTGTNASDFAQTNTCPASSSTLAAGAKCTISVTFTPTATGSRTASVSITDNASGSPHTVAVSGTGTTASSALFSDGFESGSLPGAWTSTKVSGTNSLALDSSFMHTGAASLKAVVTKGSTGTAYISKTITGQTSLDARGYYYLNSPVNFGAVQLMSLYAQKQFIGWVTYNVDPTTPTFTVYNGANNTLYTCSAVPSLKAWHSIELQYTLSTTTTGSFTLWLDGTQVCGKTGIKTSPQSGLTINQVVVGSDSADKTVGLTVHVDDVVVNTSYIGP
jgi:hypothetical protein